MGSMTISLFLLVTFSIHIVPAPDLYIVGEPLPGDIFVTVSDSFSPPDDGNAYAFLDSFHWLVEFSSPPDDPLNFSVVLSLGEFPEMYPTWNENLTGWEYAFSPDSEFFVGDHHWRVDVTNYTDSLNATGIITVWHPVIPVQNHTLVGFNEDETFLWNASGAFRPGFDQAGEPLSFVYEGLPAGWFISDVYGTEYTWWNITPPEDYFGEEQIKVTAEDSNGESNYLFLHMTVTAVNDPPVFEHISCVEEDLELDFYNYKWVDVIQHSQYRRVVNITLDEDTSASFSINARDVDDANISYEAHHVDMSPPYVLENDVEGSYIVVNNFTFTPDSNVNGNFWVRFNLSDASLGYDTFWVQFIVHPINDAPSAEPGWGPLYRIVTGEEINVSVINIEDPDGDDIDVIWYIDGTEVSDWNFDHFPYTWDLAGRYNISASVTDGMDTVDVGYFHVNVTQANIPPRITANASASSNLIKEGEELVLTVSAEDPNGDGLDFTWTNNAYAGWSMYGDRVLVDDLEPGEYIFTVTVSDGDMERSSSVQVTVIEDKDDPKEESDEYPLGLLTLLIVVLVFLIVISIIILVVVKAVGKRQHEATDRNLREREKRYKKIKKFEEEEIPTKKGKPVDIPHVPEQSIVDASGGATPDAGGSYGPEEDLLIQEPEIDMEAHEEDIIEEKPVEDVRGPEPPDEKDDFVIEEPEEVKPSEGEISRTLDMGKNMGYFEDDTTTDISREFVEKAKAKGKKEDLYGGFAVGERIGKGGFSEVYLAVNGDGVRSALKLPYLEDMIDEDPKIEKKFEKEAGNWSKLLKYRGSKEGIVAVYSHGKKPKPYIAMEYMDRGNLRKNLKNMDHQEKVECIRTILRTLHRVHHLGVIHRDIKPENILLNSRGEWKIADWGLSKVLLDSSGTQTQMGTIKATVSYAAPEQIDSETFGMVDWRTDIYQVGVLAYEILAGRRPFEGTTSKILFAVVTKEPEDPRSVNPKLDRRTADAILKAIRKQKEDRWQGAIEFLNALS